MSNFLSRLSPTAIMLTAALIAMVLTSSAILLSVDRPYLDLPEGAVPTIVGDVTLQETDLISEPDFLGTYPKMTGFFARQDLIVAELAKPVVTVTYITADGLSESDAFTPRPRQIADLPFPFWFQQGVGVLALLVAGWVMSLRRDDWGARMFALTGVFVSIFAIAASVYSTRQIALPGDTFKLLSQANHFGAGAFGIALVGLFVMYPRPMFHPRWLLAPLVLFGAGIVLDLLYVGTDVWLNLIVPTQTLMALGFGVIQWWRSRRDPLSRAGLRWFFLFTLVGVSLFVSLSVLPPALGMTESGLIPQAYAFGFFNLMHIGLALGIVRWRVFELDRYAYYVWLWLAGAILIFVTDLVLLFWLRDQPWESFVLALLIGGFLYFPLRQLLLVRLFGSKTPEVSGMIPEVIDVALAPTQRLQNDRWDALLQDTFAPAAEIEILKNAPSKAVIADNGVALELPALSGLAGRRLRYASGGRRLFSTADVQAAATLARMHGVVSDSHLAYERGVNVERDRISRDVHDNIGAQLLSALHAAEGSRKDALLRDTLTDLRQIISDGFRTNFLLADIAADLRAEMADRLEVHDIKLDWPADTLLPLSEMSETQVPFLMVNTLRSILREITSNIIKHADATQVHVRLTSSEDMLALEIRDNGRGFDMGQVTKGAGLDNMAERVRPIGGSIRFDGEGVGMAVHVSLPLDVYTRSELAEAAM
jgi:signal transduction histidine kinase